MVGFFSKVKEKFSSAFASDDFPEQKGEDYVELQQEQQQEGSGSKILVRPFVIEEFEDVKPILNVMRQGYTIALVNIAPIKDKDIVELKRAVNKIKKTSEAINGDVAGFGEDWIVVCPPFAQIYRNNSTVDNSQTNSKVEIFDDDE